MDPGSHQDQVCPRVTYNCGNRTVESLAGSLAACCILVTLSAMSCLGAILILISYAVLKDIRKGAQTIITVLAFADLVYSISLIVAGINYFAYYKETEPENCEVYPIICKIQGFLTLLGYWGTFVWTSALAFYFFMLYVFKAASWAMKLMPLYNLLSWGIPVTIALTLLILDKLGLYPGWLVCYTKPDGSSGEKMLLLLLGGWFPELISCAFVSILYTVVGVHICRQRRQLNLGSTGRNVEKRLLLIPIVYIILRIWNTAEYILLSTPGFNTNPCDESSLRTFFDVITILQVIADSSQGWINAVFYVFLSRMMRKRLFWNPLMKLFRMLKRNRQSVHPRSGHRRRIPMGRSKPISEVTAFFQQTANVTTPHPAQGYDTHFSPSHEWLTSAQPDCQSKADSGMHTHSSISSKDDLQPSTVGQCDTYFSTRFTDIASKT